MSETIKKYKIQQLVDESGNDFVTMHPETNADIVLASEIKKDDTVIFAENTSVQAILESLCTKDTSSNAIEIYKVTSAEASTVQDLRALYEKHIAAGKYYNYDLSEFDSTQKLTACILSFTDTDTNKFFTVHNLLNNRIYSDNLGYAYNSAYPLSDYFDGMNIGYPFKVLKVTRTDLTFSFIETALAQINSAELEIKLFFDLSALSPNAYFCTISVDSTNKVATVKDILNGKFSKITYDNTTLLTDIISYIENPIKVCAELPSSGEYTGDMCLVKNYGWKDLTTDSDLVQGQTYQLKIPANYHCFTYSSVGNYVEVLNMTVKSSGKEAQTYSYDAQYDDLIHTGSLCTEDAFYIITSVNKEDRTFVGYDFTTTTGDTQFLATGIYNSKNIVVTGNLLKCLAIKQDNFAIPKIWNGYAWSDIASKANIADSQKQLLLTVDLSSYSVGDIIPDELIESLLSYKCRVKYANCELSYIRESDETISGYSRTLAYEAINFIKKTTDYHTYIKALALGKSTKDSKWYLVAYYQPRMAAYTPDTDKLTIQGDSSDEVGIASNDSSKIVNLKVNASQGDSMIEVNLPSKNGTLALTSDAEVTADKIATALGYTPVNKTDSNLDYYYTRVEVDEKIKESGGGTTVIANPTTSDTDPDLATIGIGTTNYNLNAKKLDGHDVDDLTAIINAAYVPDVTVDSMNTAIDQKINDALAALEFNRYYTGTTEPASDFGNDGDLYLQQ